MRAWLLLQMHKWDANLYKQTGLAQLHGQCVASSLP